MKHGLFPGHVQLVNDSVTPAHGEDATPNGRSGQSAIRVGTAIGLGMLSFGVGAFMLLAKSKKHYIGLTWADGDKKGGLAMQCDKSDYRGILAALEGVSGKKAVNSDTMTVKN